MDREQRLVEGVIGSLGLFRSASPAQRSGVAARSRAVPLPRGSALVRRGERLPGVVAVAYGSVKLGLRANGADERVMALVLAGQSFGEAVALLGSACPYEPVAVVDSRLVVIPPAAIFALIDRDPRLARGLVTALAERNLGLVAELHAAAPRRGLQRLAAYLDSLDGAGCKVRLPGTKTLVASRLGMTKETLSRLLRSLSERGIIAVSRREISILDRARLLALVEVERVALERR